MNLLKVLVTVALCTTTVWAWSAALWLISAPSDFLVMGGSLLAVAVVISAGTALWVLWKEELMRMVVKKYDLLKRLGLLSVLVVLGITMSRCGWTKDCGGSASGGGGLTEQPKLRSNLRTDVPSLVLWRRRLRLMLTDRLQRVLRLSWYSTRWSRHGMASCRSTR